MRFKVLVRHHFWRKNARQGHCMVFAWSGFIFRSLWFSMVGFHFSLGHQKATLGSCFALRFWLVFGLEVLVRGLHVLCMVGVATSTEPLSKPVACPAGVCLLVVASFFLGRQKATLESFEGMVLAGLGLNPGVLLFRNHAPRSSFQTTRPLPHSPFPNLCLVLAGFLCLWLHHIFL